MNTEWIFVCRSHYTQYNLYTGRLFDTDAVTDIIQTYLEAINFELQSGKERYSLLVLWNDHST